MIITEKLFKEIDNNENIKKKYLHKIAKEFAIGKNSYSILFLVIASAVLLFYGWFAGPKNISYLLVGLIIGMFVLLVIIPYLKIIRSNYNSKDIHSSLAILVSMSEFTIGSDYTECLAIYTNGDKKYDFEYLIKIRERILNRRKEKNQKSKKRLDYLFSKYGTTAFMDSDKLPVDISQNEDVFRKTFIISRELYDNVIKENKGFFIVLCRKGIAQCIDYEHIKN